MFIHTGTGNAIIALNTLKLINAIDQEGQDIDYDEDIYYRLCHFRYSSSCTRTFSILPMYMVWKSRCG